MRMLEFKTSSRWLCFRCLNSNRLNVIRCTNCGRSRDDNVVDFDYGSEPESLTINADRQNNAPRRIADMEWSEFLAF